LFKLFECDVRLPKVFRQTVPRRWLGCRKIAVTELVTWSLDQARSIVSRPHRTAFSDGCHVSVRISIRVLWYDCSVSVCCVQPTKTFNEEQKKRENWKSRVG